MATAPSNTAGSTNEMDEFIKKSRVTRAAPPKPAYDPLQFVQIKPAKLYDLNKAKPSTERKLEVKAQREVVVEDAEEWQCNLDNWKSSRRKRVEHIIDKITEAKKIEQEEVCRGRKKSKTFSEMLENSGSRRRFILPGTDDDDEGGSFSDDLQDNQRVSSKEHYKDESTDERTTDDTESCSSSKQTDGESKTPDLIESLDTPEVNEFSLAIENYKSKFPMTQNRSSLLNSGTTTTSITTTTITSSNSSSSNLVTMTTLSSHTVEKELSVQKPIVSEAEAQSLFTETADAPSSNESLEEDEGPSEQQTQKEQEVTPKVNIIERRRLFEQFQRLSCISDDAGSALPSSAATPPTRTVKLSGTVGNGQEQQPDRERLCDDAPTSTDEPASSSSDWLAAGATSIKERRAIFERYQSMEGGDEQEQFVGRSRSNSSAVVIKSRSESNVVGGGCKGGAGAGTVGQRYELTLEHLKRSSNGADCCEDSGIQSTDLSRSSVVSQADDSEMLQLLSDVGKSPIRSAATLDSASEFSDTECSNGQLIENALDVAFEEMDSELNETSVVTEDAGVTVQGNHTSSQQLELPETTELTEECLVPLSVVPCPPDFVAPVEEFNDELVLLSLPKSKLTPPKEKPPPPPVDDEPEADQQPSATATGSVTSWMQQAACSAMHQNGADLYRDSKSNGTNRTLAAGTGQGNGRLEDFQLQEDNFRQLESYEVVQQVQLEQRKRFEEQKDHERNQERQELLVYSNRIETQPHHHSLYEAGEHEEIVSVERELLQIEQEEMQRRRDKQMFYEKLSKGDPPRLSELQPSTQQQQQQHQQQHQQQQQQQQLQTHQQSQHQLHQQKQDPYYHHPHHHHQHHHHHHHNHHHRASMPAIDSRSLQNVNAYGAFETPFLDDVSSYEMGSLHRESMPNLSQVPAYSSHPSSLSSYGEGYSTNSATSFDGGWAPMNRQSGGPLPDRRPIIAPRPTMNGFVEHHHHQQAATDLSGAGGGFNAADRSRLYSNVFEQHPKDNKQNVYHPGASVNRVSSGGNGATSATSYGQHWLVQEAEQRRIEQHQKNSAGTKRPLPKFVIDAITQRVQKLNAGGAGSEHSDNLSEDSDLAIINSMKHHHNQPLGTSVPQAHHQQQQYSNTSDKVLSVSGKKECSHCRIELGKGAAMAIESLGLFYHIECFKCCVCHVKLGDGTNGIDVRVRKYRLHCQNCFSSEDGVKFSCV